MKLLLLTIYVTGILFINPIIGQSNINAITAPQQNNIMDSFQYTFQSAHPNAQLLMTDDFYWSPIEETAPFGSDDGSDAAYEFRQWRLMNKTTSPVTYLKELIANWHSPFFDYTEMDTVKIKEYMNQKRELSEDEMQQNINILKEVNKNSKDTSSLKLDDAQLREIINSSLRAMGTINILAQDNAIIGTGFAQFVLEGHIDNDIKALTIIAIQRQLLPLFIDKYDEKYRGTRIY